MTNKQYTCATCGNITTDPYGGCFTCGRHAEIDKHGIPTGNFYYSKKILDACCGGRTFWFNKKHPETLYIDIKPRPKGTCPERPEWNCQPDIIADFTNLPFSDNRFHHIIWDPPHLLNLNKESRLAKKYGSLYSETWQYQLKKGFSELWRVLKPGGTLVFKWNEGSISVKKVMKLFSQPALYGHPTSKNGKTKWMIFYKSEV